MRLTPQEKAAIKRCPKGDVKKALDMLIDLHEQVERELGPEAEIGIGYLFEALWDKVQDVYEEMD